MLGHVSLAYRSSIWPLLDYNRPRRFHLPTSSLSRSQLLQFARVGARARLDELRREMQLLEDILGSRQARRKTTTREQPAASSDMSGARLKPRWSAAKRKAVSERMKRYWAARRRDRSGK